MNLSLQFRPYRTHFWAHTKVGLPSPLIIDPSSPLDFLALFDE